MTAGRGTPFTTTTARQAIAQRRLRAIVCRGCGKIVLRMGWARYCGETCKRRVEMRRWRRRVRDGLVHTPGPDSRIAE